MTPRSAAAAEPRAADPVSPTGVTLLDRLRALYPEASRRSHKQWIEGGRITVNGLVARDARAAVDAGDHVALTGHGSSGASGGPRRLSRPRSG